MSKMDNLVSAEIDAETVQRLVEQIRVIQSQLEFLVRMTNEERHRLARPGQEILEALPKLADAAVEHPKHFPAEIFDVAELRRDLALTAALAPLHTAAKELADDLSDTRMAAESDAYRTGLSGWVLAKVAVRQVPELGEVIEQMRRILDRRSRP
jgi:hypothetical protein